MASVYVMQHIAHDPFRNREINQDLDVTMVELEQLFRESDVLCINCDLNPGTEGFVDTKLLSLMKPNAFLINTARGPIVNQRRSDRNPAEKQDCGGWFGCPGKGTPRSRGPDPYPG